MLFAVKKKSCEPSVKEKIIYNYEFFIKEELL